MKSVRLAQANENLNACSDDIENWEITLILTIRLNHTEAATLLAISVQEEEEFVEKYINGLTDEFLCPYTKGISINNKT